MEEVQAAGSSAFGTLLREYRLAAGLSQEALAERARMSSHGVSALERGYRRTPQRETLVLLVGALGLNDEQRRAFERAAARTGLIRRGTLGESASWPDGSTSALPLSLTSFVGREVELAEIAALVQEHRLVTLTGSGGVGKTQTALQLGAALRETNNAPVHFVGLAPISDPSFVPTAVLSAVGLSPVSGRTPIEALLAHLQNRAVVLILDNCEHVIAEAARAANAILVNCGRVRILATSREPLKIAGEYTYRLPSLNLPAAVDLFAERARAIDHNFALTGESSPIVAELCRHLDCIPLAIELAAARVNLLPVKAISERLADRFRLLTGGQRSALPRQQTMRAAIDWSYDLLSEAERRLFERLSVFAGGCTVEAAAAVYATESNSETDVFELLSSLVDKSLVVADFEEYEPRYRLLESFQEYAREKLVARGDAEAASRRHLQAFLETAECIDHALRTEGYAFWLAAIRDADNWRIALKFALADGFDVLRGQRLASVLPVGLIPVEGRRWVRLALELVDERTPPSVVARLRFAEAMSAFALREFAVAVSSCRTVIALYGELGDPLRVALAQDMAGHALASLGQIAEAKALIESALTSARKMADRRLLAWTLRCLAYATAKGGDLVAAREYLAEALPVYKEHFYKGGDLAWAINDLGMYEFCAGNVEKALAHATEMLAVAREAGGGARSIATALNAMSVYLTASGRYDEAEERAREALDVAREHHMDAFVAYGLQSLEAVAALRPQQHAENAPRDAYRRAARILGCVDSSLAAMGSSRPMVQEQQYERVLQALSIALGKDALADLMAAGASMTHEQAVASALDP